MPISPAETLEAMQWLHGHYASPQGLARPNGLSINGRPDFEGVAAWILDVFLNSRLANHSVPTSKHNVVCAIERTSEWQAKHPGQALQVGTPYQPTLTIDRGEFLRTLHRLDVYYTSWNGLQRPNGMSINGAPDFEAIAAWVFGVYLNARLSGQSPETSWDRIITIIQSTVEWQGKQRVPPDADTLDGKHLVGYQGWFGTPNDGQNNGWDHWCGPPGVPIAPLANFDLWPDTREFFDSELEASAMTLTNGEPAKLFSSHNLRTLRRHFDWMADAGIDGVSLGRFLAGTRDQGTRRRLDHLLTNMALAADETGRVFFIWYDVTDSPAASFVADMKRDWQHVRDGLRICDGDRYLFHNQRPFVGLWGAGAGGRPGTPAEWLEVLQFLKTHDGGATVLLGGTRDWRTNATWGNVFAAADVISPWAVTAFHDDASADNYRTTDLEPDLAVTSARGQGYLPTLFPGFSWHNLQRGLHPQNGIRRRAGDFYWRQAFNAVDAGVSTLFTAMFDEVDEGTAILKVAETQRDVPQQGAFLSLDMDGRPLPSDWYLRLAGAAGRMLRHEIPLTRQIPI
jgi:hypothetical protein